MTRVKIRKPWGCITKTITLPEGEMVEYRHRKPTEKKEKVEWVKPVHLEAMEKLNGWEYVKGPNFNFTFRAYHSPCRAGVNPVSDFSERKSEPPFFFMEKNGLNITSPLGRKPEMITMKTLHQHRPEPWSDYGVFLGVDEEHKWEDDIGIDHVVILTPDLKKISIRADDIRPAKINNKAKPRGWRR